MQSTLDSVRWELFALEEKDAILKLVDMQEAASIVCVVQEMTPEKELEIQKIVDSVKPLVSEFESEVMKNYIKTRLEAGLPASPENPAEEAELQKALDKEMADFQAKQEMKNKERLAALDQKLGLNEAGKFCEFCDTKGHKHLKDCARPQEKKTE